MRRFRSSNNSNNNPRRGMLASKAPVGTEAVALKNIRENSKTFDYPPTGFTTPIEHSLLYATIGQPNLFPNSVIQSIMADEDFTQYLYVRHDDKLNNNPDGTKTSYAQLSAILALAAEVWPPDNDISKLLCKALLQCIVQYSDEHGLDRESEVRELMLPLLRLNERRAGRNALATLLPMYAGLAAAMVTLNPALLWAGYAIGNYYNIKAAVDDSGRQKKMQAICTETNRAGDVEQTSLLDETEHS
ncbi:hypothetical protein MPSEU_000667300 [Mayamaea pseudoterrestris]|nr:hypothetical protein MPSEU_000667300 [Mayamaea pseudoterrestris]